MAALLDARDEPLARGFEQALPNDRLQRREHEEKPEELVYVHNWKPPLIRFSIISPHPIQTVLIGLERPAPGAARSAEEPAEDGSGGKAAAVRPPGDAATLVRRQQGKSPAEQ